MVMGRSLMISSISSSSLLILLFAASSGGIRWQESLVNGTLSEDAGTSASCGTGAVGDFDMSSGQSLLQMAPLNFDDTRACPRRKPGRLSDLYDFYVEYVKVTWPKSRNKIDFFGDFYGKLERAPADEVKRYENATLRFMSYKSNVKFTKTRDTAVRFYATEETIKTWIDLQSIFEKNAVRFRKVMLTGSELYENDTAQLGPIDFLIVEHYVVPGPWAQANRAQGAQFPKAFLAKGSFGAVYLAEERRSKALVAVKEIHQDKVDSFDWVEVAVGRKSLACNMGIQNVYYHRAANGTLDAVKLVYPYIEGMELYDYYDKFIYGPRSVIGIDVIRVILAQIAWGVLALHHHKVLHRDLKLQNAMIRPDTREVTIIDYGLALLDCDGRQGCKDGMAGTIGYMSPDIAKRPYGYEVDWYSVGVIAYVLTLRKLPFRLSKDVASSDMRGQLKERNKFELNFSMPLSHVTKKVDGTKQEKKDLIDLVKLMILPDGRDQLKKAREAGTLAATIHHLPFWGPPQEDASSPLLAFITQRFPDAKPIEEEASESSSTCYKEVPSLPSSESEGSHGGTIVPLNDSGDKNSPDGTSAPLNDSDNKSSRGGTIAPLNDSDNKNSPGGYVVPFNGLDDKNSPGGASLPLNDLNDKNSRSGTSVPFNDSDDKNSPGGASLPLNDSDDKNSRGGKIVPLNDSDDKNNFGKTSVSSNDSDYKKSNAPRNKARRARTI
eukprot:TRINITY_DN4452_c0_g1_i1.p1 TRINITY_DN4452_c0_g1~~TRINITY_DN4452_c0_g1_i1.p1  ORF type:complete len:738 (+),score=83.67 TRINITY_DN4452_c0_g1_i1:56-2215(+)